MKEIQEAQAAHEWQRIENENIKAQKLDVERKAAKELKALQEKVAKIVRNDLNRHGVEMTDLQIELNEAKRELKELRALTRGATQKGLPASVRFISALFSLRAG